MKSLLPLAALPALLLAACQNEPEVVDTRARDPNAAAVANAATVELPPAIRLQKSYRCRDQSLAYVTWFVGNEQVNVRSTPTGEAVKLETNTGTSPWTSAVGWTLAGDDSEITLTQPGKAPQICRG